MQESTYAFQGLDLETVSLANLHTTYVTKLDKSSDTTPSGFIFSSIHLFIC